MTTKEYRPTGVYHNLDILRQDIQTPPGFYKNVYVIADIWVWTKHKLKKI